MANGLEIAQAYVQILPSFEGITSELSKGLTPAAEASGENAGEKSGKSFLGKLGKVVAGGAAAALAGVTAAATSLVSGVKDLAAYGDNIDKMSQKLGMSAQAYQEWGAIMQHSGTSIDSMTSSMKTLVNAAASGSDAFTKIGLSQQQIASMSQEELFGATITALQNMESGAERTALANQLLGRGATELGALLNTSAEETEAMRQRVHELGGVLSDEAVKDAAAFQDSLQDMQTAFTGLGRGLLSDFMPSITTVMNGLTEIFSGNSGSGVAMIKDGISDLVSNISETMPQFLDLGVGIVTSLAQAIVENLPQLLSAGMDAIMSFVDGLIDMLPQILESGITLVVTLVKGLIEAIPRLVENVPKIISAIWNAIKNTNWLELGKSIITSLINGLISMAKSLLSAVGQLVKNIWEGFKNINWKEVGSNIIDGIKNGVKNAASNLINSVKDAAKRALDGVKNFLGIHSPSRVFEMQVGEMIPLGAAEGITNESDSVKAAVKQMSKDAIGSFDTDFSVYGSSTQNVTPGTDENILRMILQAATMIVSAIDNKEINGYPGDAYVGKVATNYIRAEQRRTGTSVV